MTTMYDLVLHSETTNMSDSKHPISLRISADKMEEITKHRGGESLSSWIKSAINLKLQTNPNTKTTTTALHHSISELQDNYKALHDAIEELQNNYAKLQTTPLNTPTHIGEPVKLWSTHEVEIVESVRNMREVGHSASVIAKELNGMGYLSATGKQFTKGAVEGIIKRRLK